ncbi:MAG: GNAT family N-acetyltransferase [Deferribacteraceae bacterium]|jgi:ribosomal protein S18 acetylase RimI-like enzyme|nr:GNAT family N-acetyltransferase [Deferribacteraceae bacterium]
MIKKLAISFRSHLLPTDPAAIYAIVCDTGFFREEEAIIARELAEETLANPSEYEFIFAQPAGLEDDDPVAYICYAEIPGTVGSYELYWIAVLKRFQRQGLGKQLIQAAEADIKARGGRLVYISTSGTELYSGTRIAYERAGYSQAAVLKDFYLPGDDQVIYVKKL